MNTIRPTTASSNIIYRSPGLIVYTEKGTLVAEFYVNYSNKKSDNYGRIS